MLSVHQMPLIAGISSWSVPGRGVRGEGLGGSGGGTAGDLGGGGQRRLWPCSAVCVSDYTATVVTD